MTTNKRALKDRVFKDMTINDRAMQDKRSSSTK